MKQKKINFEALEVEDVYSASMFLLYKLNNDPQYSIISELPYILSRKDLLKFCNYFGGMTFKVPTIKELNDTFKILLVYQNLSEGQDLEICRKQLNLKTKEFNKIYDEVKRLAPLLDNYNSEFKKNYD